jgi:hypothetical protein
LGLNTLQEGGNQGDLSSSFHYLNDFGEVNLSGQELKEVVEKHRLFFEVENNSAVPEIVVCNLNNVLGENIVSPGRWRVLHHSDYSLVLLLVGSMQEYSLWPHLELLTRSDQLGDQKFVCVCSDVVHQTFWLVFSIQNSEVSVDSVVSSLKGHALFKQLHQLFLVPKLLVELKYFLEVVGVDNNVLAA